MIGFSDAVLLRVFIGEDDRHEGRALAAAIVEAAFARRLDGATVLCGPIGFGCSGSMRTELNVDGGPQPPMVVEIVDVDERIAAFLPGLADMVASGLITMEKVQAKRYRRRGPGRDERKGEGHGRSA